jgi:hypothetical protein
MVAAPHKEGYSPRYGDDPLQFAQYWETEPNDPLVFLIHGGCWLNAFDLTHARPLASALANRGLAVLSIEYRASEILAAVGPAPSTISLQHSRRPERLDMKTLSSSDTAPVATLPFGSPPHITYRRSKAQSDSLRSLTVELHRRMIQIP